MGKYILSTLTEFLLVPMRLKVKSEAVFWWIIIYFISGPMIIIFIALILKGIKSSGG